MHFVWSKFDAKALGQVCFSLRLVPIFVVNKFAHIGLVESLSRQETKEWVAIVGIWAQMVVKVVADALKNQFLHRSHEPNYGQLDLVLLTILTDSCYLDHGIDHAILVRI